MFDLAQNEQRSDDEISFYMLYIIFEPKINETASNMIIVIQSVFLNSLTNLFIPNYIVELKNKGNIAGFQSIVFLMAFAVALFSTLLGCYSGESPLDGLSHA